MNKNLEEYLPDGNKAQYRFMKYRIHKILLVCCSYDGYISSRRTDTSNRRSTRNTST